MYGYNHPLYSRHLMHEYAMEREALRQLMAPGNTEHDPTTTGAKWAAIVTVVVGITVIGALVGMDASTTDQSSKAPYTCTVGGNKVFSFAPCPPAS